MKFVKYLLVFSVLALFIPNVYANTDANMDTAADFTVFETIYTPAMPELEKPTVVSIKLPNDELYGVAILEEGNEIPQPWLKIKKYEDKKINVKSTSALLGNKSALTDLIFDTTAEFDIDQDEGVAFLELESENEFTSSSLQLSLDSHVALPQSIALSALVDGKWKTIIAEKKLDSAYITFPETTAKTWKIEFKHGQLLRFREIELIDKADESLREVEIRWLARPEKTYTIYTDARIYPQIKTSEAGILQGEDLEVIALVLGESAPNPVFKEPDDDNDGVVNLIDNCVSDKNSDQADIDDNGRGDVCEDDDGDGIINSKDNCPQHPNYNQVDTDSDSLGDACDTEESRLTEKNPWIVWGAMGLAALIVFVIVIQTVKTSKK
jgi:hypothetical protein